MMSFEEAWAKKQAEGYQYGEDALEQVRFGWEIHEAESDAVESDHLATLHDRVAALETALRAELERVGRSTQMFTVAHYRVCRACRERVDVEGDIERLPALVHKPDCILSSQRRGTEPGGAE